MKYINNNSINIICKIDCFFKQAQSLGNLEDLLKDALATGDKSQYLVFLDLLEEQRPTARAAFNTNSLHQIIIKLNELFPNIIDNKNGIFEFITPLFCDLKGISFNSHNQEIEYLYYPKFNFLLRGVGNRLIFEENSHPTRLFEDIYPIRQIIYWYGKRIEVLVSTPLGERYIPDNVKKEAAKYFCSSNVK